MKLSPFGYAEIASHEGICLRPYFDSVGVLTFGIGHTKAAGGIDPATLPPDKDQPVEKVLATYMQDMAAVEADVNRLVKVPLKPYQYDALCSFHFNTGGLARASLLVALNRGDYDAAADGFMNWVKPPEIKGRRTKEQTLFRMGVYSADGMVNVFPVSPNGNPLYGHGQEMDIASRIVAMANPENAPSPIVPPEPWDAPAYQEVIDTGGSPRMKWVQEQLSRLQPSMQPLKPDGILGPKTTRATSAFQMARGLKAGGGPDDKTVAELKRLAK